MLWAGSIIDTTRGIVFIATGSAGDDFYGVHRPGNNLFANCVIALNANTGKMLWYFQATHHDLWDSDFAAPPVLLTVNSNGKRVDAVAATNKFGFIYIFDRVTGKPLFPIVETKVPASTVPGEMASPTQPIPTLPKPLAKQTLGRDEVTNRTPEMRAWAQQQWDTFFGHYPGLHPSEYRQEHLDSSPRLGRVASNGAVCRWIQRKAYSSPTSTMFTRSALSPMRLPIVRPARVRGPTGNNARSATVPRGKERRLRFHRSSMWASGYRVRTSLQ